MDLHVLATVSFKVIAQLKCLKNLRIFGSEGSCFLNYGIGVDGKEFWVLRTDFQECLGVSSLLMASHVYFKFFN